MSHEVKSRMGPGLLGTGNSTGRKLHETGNRTIFKRKWPWTVNVIQHGRIVDKNAEKNPAKMQRGLKDRSQGRPGDERKQSRNERSENDGCCRRFAPRAHQFHAVEHGG